MRSKRFWFTVVFSCLTGIGIAVFFDYRDAHPITEDAYVKAHIVSIASRVSGPVLLMHVSDNEYVKEGQLLFELEPSSFETDTDEALANYRIALQKNAARKAMVESAKSYVQENTVVLARAKRTFERATTLAESELISESKFDLAAAEHARALASLRSAKADLLRAESELGVSGENNPIIKAAEARLQSAKLKLSFTKVHAPVSGWVTNLSLRTGEMVIAERAQFSIVDDATWWVEANFKEVDLKRMRPNQSASIRIDMYPDLRLSGKVSSLGAGSGAVFSLLPPENATGNWVKITQRFPVTISLDRNEEGKNFARPLRVGSSAVVTVHVDL
jgi:membrane fusion protein (multidrug efflux system)